MREVPITIITTEVIMERIINVTIALAVIIGLSLTITDTISAQNKRTDAPIGSGNGGDAG